MEPNRLLLPVLILVVLSEPAFAQNGWTVVNDPTNAVNSFQPPGQYIGAGWIDLDNDGDIDLFVAPNGLFRNDGAETFTYVSPGNSGMLSTFFQAPSGSSWADLDNDGHIDCILGQWPSAIYRNNGDGTFADQTSGIDSLTDFTSWGCSIGDLDEDPFLDLVYLHANDAPPNSPDKPCRIFQRNDAAFSATPLAGYEITEELGPFTVPYWSDYDLDGDMDLFVAAGPITNTALDYCYRNMKVETGQDTLYRMSTELFAQEAQDGQCYNFIDYDNDGDLDLCLSNYQATSSRLYRNDNGTYVSVLTPFTSSILRHLSNNWGDFDNDGDLDVIFTGDNNGTRYYRNDGASQFSLVAGGMQSPTGACGVTNGDYDNDGDLDVYISGTVVANRLARNDTVAGGRHWLNLKLVGTTSNRSAIGAIVRSKATIGGQVIRQLREVNAQNSFQSQNDLRVHFGLGDAMFMDSLSVTWPSGLVQTFSSVAANGFYTLVEGEALSTAVPEAIYPVPSLVVLPNPAGGSVAISSERLRGANWSILNTRGQLIQTGRSGSDTITLDTSRWPDGTYHVQIGANGNGTAATFLIIH